MLRPPPIVRHVGRAAWLAATALAAVLTAAQAQAKAPTVGSDQEAVIDPDVAHPQETPCSVSLVNAAQFTNFTPYSYSFTPPAACPGPWAKVVLKVHLSLNAGVQYDRTGLLTLNGVPLWFGTTAEPDRHLGPRWAFQRDLTDYTALFETAQSGSLSIGNVVNSTYTGVITATVSLDFYPASSLYPAPVTADVVLPLPQGGGSGTLNTGTDTIATTMIFPTNVLKANLDLYLQGQSDDEFWYTCVPNALTGTLESCGNGPLREGEIAVDGMAAGVAPVFPWIFTGGIDPLLWQPIPGVQTLDFKPFTVDLSPFAGVLSNGASHTISASVFGANSYFAATGALRLFLDHGASRVTGSVTEDTLRPRPTVSTNSAVSTQGGVTEGSVEVYDIRDFTIKGSVTGSAGTMVNVVRQKTSFHNNQRFTIGATTYAQEILQHTDTTLTSTTTQHGTATSTTTTLSWPFRLDYTYNAYDDGGGKQRTTVHQEYSSSVVDAIAGVTSAQTLIDDMIESKDALLISHDGYIKGNSGQSENARYTETATGVPCYAETLIAADNLISAVTKGCE